MADKLLHFISDTGTHVVMSLMLKRALLHMVMGSVHCMNHKLGDAGVCMRVGCFGPCNVYDARYKLN